MKRFAAIFSVLLLAGIAWASAATSVPQSVYVRTINVPTGFNPADATSYFVGSNSQFTASSGFNRVYVPSNCTLKKAHIWLQGGNGSNETSTISIRVNNTTDTTISSSILCTSISTITTSSNNTMNLSLSAGDFFEIKWVTPTWATNPTSVNGGISLEFAQ